MMLFLCFSEDESCDESEEDDGADLVGTIQPEHVRNSSSNVFSFFASCVSYCFEFAFLSQCTSETFFSHPSASKFMGLGDDKATVLSQFLNRQVHLLYLIHCN